ncbi:MAG: class I SAM-dependent methyltransferase, partial [gamma proteobacterium symbiont of Lucinoma myriamae]|nr:class I SAM-dependent methyltransferase [gamma proteobacterium symbiont of Lucinoma myriamae]
MNKTINHCNQKASDFFSQYESSNAETIHSSWIHHLNEKGGLALDVGSGSGRDALWLAKNGYEVFAVEPAESLRNLAKINNNHSKINWFDDTLPELKIIYRLNIKFNLILLSAVWMHIAESNRERVFRKIANLLKPGGKLVITLRHGISPDEREMYDVSFSEISNFAKSHALTIVTHQKDKDKLQRDEVKWEAVVLQLPDDGTGAFPLLRNIIINDNKSSTYKLALLRVLLRIADGMPGVAREYDEDNMVLPLG